MKTIHKIVLKSYFGPFVATLCISIFILVMQFLWKYIDDLVGKGLEWSIIGQLLFYASLTLVPMALPLAILLSSIMTFGNLGENYELVALKSAGLSLYQIMFPLIIVSIFLSGIAFYFSNNVLPDANLKMHSLLYDVRDQKAALKIKESVFYNGIDGYSIRVRKKEPDGKTLRDIMIYDHTAGVGNNKVIVAESGSMEMSADKMYLLIDLKNGASYEEGLKNNDIKKTPSLTRSVFDQQLLRFNLSGFKLTRTDESLFKNNYQMLHLQELSDNIDSLKKDNAQSIATLEKQLNTSYYVRSNRFLTNADSAGTALKIKNKTRKDFLENNTQQLSIIETASNLARSAKSFTQSAKDEISSSNKSISLHSAEFHRKFTLSFACLILFFIGAPLGAIIRKGGLGMPVVVSVVFFILFHVLSITGEKLVKEGALPAYKGMWIAPIVLFPIGVFLTYKASADSQLFDIEIYKRPFRRLFSTSNPK